NDKNPRTSGNCIYAKERNTDTGTVYSHHLIIRKNKAHHCGGGGIVVDRSDYVTIEDNEVYSNAWWSVHGCSGISLFHPYDTDENRGYKNFIRRNRTYDNRMFIKWITKNAITDGNGIIIDDTKNTQIKKPAYKGRTLVENNISYLNGGSGIHAYQSAHVDIVNNTSYMNGVSPELEGEIYSNNSDDIKILNNVMYGRAGEKINHNWGSTNYVNDFNVYFNTSGIGVKGSNDIEADPKFENPAIGDFRLKAGSPAIDSGTATLFAATDVLGATRAGTSVDRGAYEY
ncbi:MAG: right-handed parallel beta-helix repeat-containing protein, partial [Pseudobdellovibrionaceae bacterium]|nr:right-handed parallel beta-helix repeat-containing protein [Pseudobdellovibrionaceae bacterium]